VIASLISGTPSTTGTISLWRPDHRQKEFHSEQNNSIHYTGKQVSQYMRDLMARGGGDGICTIGSLVAAVQREVSTYRYE
jgi:outer membrane lipoprotein-sorting protein